MMEAPTTCQGAKYGPRSAALEELARSSTAFWLQPVPEMACQHSDSSSLRSHGSIRSVLLNLNHGIHNEPGQVSIRDSIIQPQVIPELCGREGHYRKYLRLGLDCWHCRASSLS